MRALITLEERCNPSVAGLLVVDVQNDFCSPKGASARKGNDVSGAEAMVPGLVSLIEEARKVSLPVIFIQTIHSEWTDSLPWIYRKSQQRELSTCREGTWGAELYQGIAPLSGERIVTKHRYSAFINTDLNTLLKAKGIESVLVTGVATNVCVETTARDAYMFDHYVTLVEDCCAAYDQRLHEATLENIRRHFGLVSSSREVIETWARIGKKAAMGQ